MSEISYNLVLLTVFIALAFDVLTGVHDAANSIATVVATRVLRPLTAVIGAAFFNFSSMIIFGPKVAETISQIIKIEPADPVYVLVILCALLGAFGWGLLTWRLGLPTSNSHALIGGLAGAGVAYASWGVLRMDKLIRIIEFIIIAPVLGLFLGFLLMFFLYWACRNGKPAFLHSLFRKGQLASSALFAIGQGANDAQKTMGIILALLIAGGLLSPTTKLSLYNSNTLWIVLSCQLALSLGTLFGGWRIIKTMGMSITKIRPAGGFCAETAGAITLFLANVMGIPVSSTHTITGAIIGVGSASTSLSRIKWGITTKIVWAWVLTIPGAALFAASVFYLIRLF